MHLDPAFSARTRGAFWAATLALFVAASGIAPGEDALTPVKVFGVSGFHHAGSLSEIVVLSDGKRVVSCARDGTARLWDLKSGRELRRYSRPESSDVWGLEVLPGEKRILTAGGSGYISLWEIETGKLLSTFKHGGTAFRTAMHPDGKRFVGTDNDDLAILWNLETGKQIRTFKGHTDSVYTAVFSADGERLYTGASDGKLKIWNVKTGKVIETYDEDFGDVYTLRSSPDRKHFALCSGDNRLFVFEEDPLKVVWKHKFEDDVKVVSWSRDGKQIVTSCEDGTLHVRDAEDGDSIAEITVEGGYHTPVTFTPDGKEIVSGGDRHLQHFSIKSGDRIIPELGKPLIHEGVEALALSPSGDRIYAIGDDEEMQVWNTGTGKRAGRYEFDDSPRFLEVSPDGKLLAMGGSDKSVSLVEATTGKVVRELRADGSVDCGVFVKDGTRFVAGGSDDKAWLWNVESGELLATFTGHSDDINGLAVTCDGNSLVTASDDKTARLWDLATGKEVRVFKMGDDSLHGVACLADGRSFLVAPREPEMWGWLAPERKVATTLGEGELLKLVEALAADKYSERAAASESLVERGPGILPLLEPLKPSDPEAAYRLKEVRKKIRHAEFDGEAGELHAFDEDIYIFLGDPAGRYWAATVDSGSNCRLVIGEVRDGEVKILQEISDGHSPEHLAFSADGRFLATGNRDGSVSFFAVKGREKKAGKDPDPEEEK